MTTNAPDVQERPTPVPDIPEAFVPPPTPYHRENCLRIVLPGVDSPDARLESLLEAPLLRIINDVTTDRNVERFELLSFPTEGAQEYLLHATSATIGGSSRPDTETTIPRFTDQLQAPVLNKLGEAARRRLSSRFGLEWVDLDFSPLGLSPVSTCRLVVRESRELTPSATLTYNPLERTLVALRTAREPHLYQVLIRDLNGKYRITVRLAVYSPQHNVTGDKQFAHHVLHGHEWDLAKVYEPVNVTSNFRIPVGAYWSLKDPEEYDLPPPPPDQDRVRWGYVGYASTFPVGDAGSPSEVRDIVTGKPEHERLLQGNDDHPDLYKDLYGYPRIDVTGTKLGYFVTLAPVYHKTNPWTHTPYRDAPALTTDTIIRDATGTLQAIGRDTTAAPADPTPMVSNEGGPDHRKKVPFVAQLLGEYGDDVKPVEQNTASVPDLWVIPTDGTIVMLDYETDSDRVHVEVEIANKTKGAKLLANAARSIWHDREVIFVFNSEPEARKGIETLREPFRHTTADGETLLYNGSVVTRPDGTSPAIPGQHAKSRWWLSPDGRLRVTGDIDADLAAEFGLSLDPAPADAGVREMTAGTRTATETLAAGPADDPVATYEYDCPRFVQRDGGVVIETPAGEPIAEYPSTTDCTDEWSRVYAPHVPLGLSYLESAIIMYLDGDDLEVVEPAPEWDVPGHTERYEGAIEQFAATYTVEREGAELRKGEFRSRALRWYRRQTNRKAPNNTYFGRATPYDAEPRADNRVEVFENRTWLYPRDLVSPDLPGVGAESGIGSADDGVEAE